MENKMCNCGNHECNCEHDDVFNGRLGPKREKGHELKEFHFGKDDTTYYLEQDVIDHFNTLGIENSDTWEQDLTDKKDFTTLVNALFTLHRINDAWDVIENNKENIDFSIILNTSESDPCPYFQIKRDAQDVYKYLYDQHVIDDISYAYFQIIGGQLSDLDFWNSFIGNLSTSDKLRTLNECYNGTNPFEIGLIILDDKSKKFIFDNLRDDELLDDFIIGQYPAVFFDKDILLDLMNSNNLDRINFHKYFGIILQMINTDIKNMNDEADIKNVYNTFWSSAATVLDYGISLINVNDDESLESFIKSDLCKDLVEEASHINKEFIFDAVERESAVYKSKKADETIQTMLINSLAFMNRPYYYRNMIESVGYIKPDGNIPKINANFLFENNYSYILSYKLLDFVDSKNFIIKYPFPAAMNCIYNSYDNMIFINGKCKPYDEDDLDEFEFVYDYLYNSEINDEIFKKCESLKDYEELVYAVKEFNDRIQFVLNGGVE